ncbi:MAG: hypothetical protein E7A86_19000 [Bradyrhizobium sp.]|nr:hypothetical protein [Bradyrhizobium sp.]
MPVTIYHNPACGTSRNTLAMIRASGEEPEVIEYLKTPPSWEQLIALINAMGVKVRDVLREKGTPYAALGLGDPNVVSWGSMIGSGRELIRTAWYLTALPGVVIVLTVLALNLIGDGLTDVLNPRTGVER